MAGEFEARRAEVGRYALPFSIEHAGALSDTRRFATCREMRLFDEVGCL